MKSLIQKINQVEALIDTKDVNAATNEFLTKVVRRCKATGGDTRWLSPAQVQWIEDVWERHYA